MKLQVRDTHGLVDVGFGYWLIPRIRTTLLCAINSYYLKYFDTYFEQLLSKQRVHKDITAEKIIIQCAFNLVCTGTSGDIIIQVSPVVSVNGLPDLKLNAAAKIINYGTLDMKGSNIFTDVFNQFANDIDTYVGMYYNI